MVNRAATGHCCVMTTTALEHERATYRRLFAVREFRALFVAHVVSMLGTMSAQVALTVLVFQRTGSPLLSAATFTVGFMPFLIGGALLSGLVDRLPARRTLLLCDLGSAVLFAVMTLPGLPIAALFALDFAAGLLTPVFGGARAALLPDVLGNGQRYVLGRAAVRIVSQGAQVLGFAVGGALLATAGARLALAVNAASFAASAAVVRAGVRARPSRTAATGPLLRDSLAGAHAVLSHPPVRKLLLLRSLVPTCALAPEALAAAYVQSVRQPPREVGFYLAVVPAAMVLADLLAGRLLDSRAQRRLVLPAALLTVTPLLGFAAHPALPAAMVLLALVGLGYAHTLGLDAALLATAPPDMQSRTLALDQAGLMVLQGTGFLMWGAFAMILPPHLTIAAAGACGLAVVAALPPGRLARVSSAAHRPAPRLQAADDDPFKSTHPVEADMPGASAQTRPVKILNANWTPGGEDSDGKFEFLIITEDDERHTLPATAASTAALAQLAHANTVLAWDPTNRVLIVANIVGKMPWTINRDS